MQKTIGAFLIAGMTILLASCGGGGGGNVAAGNAGQPMTLLVPLYA